MPGYSFQAVDRTGKKQRGRIESSDRQTAVQELKEKGIYVTRLEEAKVSIWKREIELGPKRLPLKDFVPFARQFATLIKAGVTIVETLRILSEQTSNKKLEKILLDAAAKVTRGNQISEALREHAQAFPPVFLNMVRAGEMTGNLEEVLERAATLMEKEHYTREKVKSAMTYPAVISVVSLVTTVYLLVNVIPNFVATFKRMGTELPLPTRIVIGLSDHLVVTWYWYTLAVALFVLLVQAVLKKPAGRYWFDFIKLKLPIFGPLFQKAAIARSSRTMETLFKSAVPALQAFTVVANIVGNEVYAKALREARDALRSGQSMSAPLRREKMFPPLVTQMIAVGEQTGSIDVMFGKIADFYEADVEATVDKLRPMIEPLMILALAVIVGVIVTAAIAPIFDMYGTLGNQGG